MAGPWEVYSKDSAPADTGPWAAYAPPSAKTPPPPDKYQEAATAELADLKAKGVDTGTGYTRRLAHGATFGADNTIIAGLTAPLEMIKRGVGPVEAYNYTKAREDEIMNQAREKTGLLGSALEIGGGAGAGLKLAQGGWTFARGLAPNAGLGARSLASAGDAAAMGGFAGFNEGNGIGDRLEKAATGGLLGGVFGGIAPGAFDLAGRALSPIISNFSARLNPERFARSQVARGIQESGQTPDQISLNMLQAANEGQGAYTLADAMGNSGQRMLSTVARAPGEGRTAVVNALEARQADQGRRVSAALAEGFDSPQTAAQVERSMTAARDSAADAAYGAVRADARPVDISGVLSRLDETLAPGVNQIANPASNIADDSIEALLRKFRARLSDGRSNLTDWQAVSRVRDDVADAAQSAFNSGHGKRGAALRRLRTDLDAALESSSSGYRTANQAFAQSSRDIDAIAQGRAAAMRGRMENTIPEFQGLSPAGQRGYRAGYVDPLIEQTQGAAYGVNKARPFTSDAFRQEAAAMAPGNAMMQRRLGREMTMFETRNHALGGSRTADNLADAEAMGVSPTLVGQLLSGNWGGAMRSTLAAGQNAVTGNTAQVRQAVANILLQRGQSMSPAALQQMVDAATQRIMTLQRLVRQLGRATGGGLAVTPGAMGRRRADR